MVARNSNIAVFTCLQQNINSVVTGQRAVSAGYTWSQLLVQPPARQVQGTFAALAYSPKMIPTADDQNRAEAGVGPNHAPFTQGVCIVLNTLCTDFVSQPWQVCTKHCAQENLVPQSGANLQTGQHDCVDEQYRHN